MNAKTVKKAFLILLGSWLILSTTTVYALSSPNRIAHAVVSMGTGMLILWVLVFGSLMYAFRERIKTRVQSLSLHWQVKFVLFAILLAMIEEAITTTMTNLAPAFGVRIGEAYITASSNYLDVVLHHSVIVFVPMFIAWAWMLKRWDFSPFWVFLLFGITGLLAETLTFGLQNLNGFGMWIFVYGLMVYLPAFCLPSRQDAKPAGFRHGIMAIFMPFLFGIPWVLILKLVNTGHPDIHFPPIQT